MDDIPKSVRNWLFENSYGPINSSHSVGGGCINEGRIIATSSGSTFFLKTNPKAPPDMFACEAEGLEALRVDDGPRVPQPFIHGDSFILMEDLSPAPKRKTYWQEFAMGMANLHRHTNPNFGFTRDNYIGSNPQPNSWMEDGFVFFGENRLMFQARLARDRGLLKNDGIYKVEKLINRLSELVPEQPASLIHGDLWTGNATTESSGAPAIIDPATHYGWAEADLAMTSLFGSFPEIFYKKYEEHRKLVRGYKSRFDLYNLYHLLNHLNLFGQGYLAQVLSILNRFS
ncbi:MAG: fructosamine kinase family protein [Anaerolineales bacterium]|jgi:fructosamine-3-kinase